MVGHIPVNFVRQYALTKDDLTGVKKDSSGNHYVCVVFFGKPS